MSKSTKIEKSPLDRLMEKAKPEFKVCLRCQRTVSRWKDFGPPDAICIECDRDVEERERMDLEATQLIGNLHRIVPEFLDRAGLRPYELRATLDEIPLTIQVLLDLSTEVEQLLAGRVPTTGIGLSGNAGIGKTCALAALMTRLARERLEIEIRERGRAALDPWMIWIAWPETVNQLRAGMTEEDGLQGAADLVSKAIAADVLVLDDVGAERLRGTYVEDWSASQLDLIIDGRHRMLRPIWFTTNLSPRGLVDRYGQRIFSRLCFTSPLIEIPSGPDLRREITAEC